MNVSKNSECKPKSSFKKQAKHAELKPTGGIGFVLTDSGRNPQ